MKRNKKGFTLVELVIVIAVIAILAGVMVAIFSGVIRRANESAELQQVKNDELKQKADDVLTKLENANWFSWEDFENSLATKLTDAYKKYGADTEKIVEQVNKAVKNAIDEYAANSATSNTSLTETQVKVIVENALANAKLGGVTEAQVRTIVNTAVNGITTLSKSDVQKIVDAATAKGLTADQVASVIGQSKLAKKSDTDAISAKVDAAIAAINALKPVTNKDIEDKIIDLLPVTKSAANATEFTTLVGRLNSGSTIVVDFDATELTIGETAGDKTLTIKGNKIGTLKIKAPKATVYLMCDVVNVNVEETAQRSVHVLGKVENLVINKGRVVLESGAEVDKLKAAPSIDAIVTIQLEQDSTITTELETQYQDHGYTEGRRDFIVIENNGDVQLTNLTASSALQSSNTTTTNVVIKNGREATGTTITEVQVDEHVGSFDITVDEVNGIADATTNKIKVELFAGGTGTQTDPYIIATAKQMQNISINYANDVSAYYKVKDGVSSIDCSNWTRVDLYGVFDGNNVTFVNLDNTLFGNLYADDVCVVKNFTVSCNITNAGYHTGGVVRYALATTTEFNNVKVKGYIEGPAVAPYAAYGPYYVKNDTLSFRFINCVASCTLVSTGETAAGFICHPYWNANAGTNSIYIDNSKFTGKMAATGSNKFNFFCTNYAKATTIYVKGDVGISKISSGYTVSENTDENGYATICKNSVTNTSAYAEAKFVDAANTSVIITATGVLPEVGATFTVTKDANATYAVATLMIGPNGNGTTVTGGNYTGIYLREELQPVDGSFTTIKVKNFDVAINDEEAEETGVVGNVFNIVNDHYGTTYGSANVKVVQYNAEGMITSITTYNIKR